MSGDLLPGGGRWASGNAAGLSCNSWLESVVPGGIAAPDTALYPCFLLSNSVTPGTHRDSRIRLLFLLSGPLRGNFSWAVLAMRGCHQLRVAASLSGEQLLWCHVDKCTKTAQGRKMQKLNQIILFLGCCSHLL